MFVTLIGKNLMYKIKLPKVAVGNYWIKTEKDEKLLNIEGNGINWQINSTNKVKLLKPNSLTSANVSEIANKNENIIEKVQLKEYSISYVYLKGFSKEFFVLYCSPIFENNFTHLNLKNWQEISIGRSEENSITYNNALIKDKQAKIFFSNGKLLLENFDTSFGTFVNGVPVSKKRKLLFNGDVIFVMGLKIIILGKNIYINNPFNLVTYNEEIFEKVENNLKVPDEIEDEEEESELYEENEYFARAPRIRNEIKREKVKIDPPPENQDKEGTPLILVLGSTLSMGIITVISMVNTVNNMKSSSASLSDTFLSLAMSAVMMIGMILFPILSSKYDKRKRKQKEATRQKRYKEYIESKIKLIENIMKKQSKILYENYISDEECAQIVVNKDSRLWERKIEDPDFLKIRLGIGDIPLDVEIEYPQKEFSMEDDNLVEMLHKIGEKSKTLKNVPITLSLAEKNIAALIVNNNEKLTEKFTQSLIMQLISLHSYDELKLVFLLKDDKSKNWEHMKTLPHIWDETKQIRFFASENYEMKEISLYLEKIFANRLEHNNDCDYKSFMPYYLIITDDYKKVENLKIITQVLSSKRNIGFGIFCITNNMLNLPNECQAFINLSGENGTLIEKQIYVNTQNKFVFDSSYTFFFENMGRQLSNIPIRYTANTKMSLPSSYTFLEMYDAGKIEQLNVLERWKTNDSTKTLQAPIGIDGAGNIISLDIHEKAHGPHGLIAGSTGSGKSEFIITYILSLAINYHPDDVTFVLIDYKGGGLAGAFQKNEIKLPHLVGTITNIDTVGLQRSLASIQSELKRRQRLFNEARNQTDEGTIDIYKYQRLYHDGNVKIPIPHLLIICDEFAELKQQQEEFMDELMSVARIGRSLGVHLILATQKPAGIVNAQIQSNCKFGICLKVQDASDSNDVIKRPDAAELKKAGQFYMQVGNNEYFVLGQSGWSGAPYIPSDVIKKNVDNSIKFISNTGVVTKEVNNNKKQASSNEGEQLTNIVKYIYELAQKEGIHAKSLWKENIPEIIYLDKTKEKYKVEKQNNVINPTIGEYDDPFNQRQGVVQLDFSKVGNIAIYGNAESGKETLLSTIVYEIMTTYTLNEVQMYLLDFGSEALKIFKDSPFVGDIAFSNDSEKISRLFDFIQKEIKDRTSILSDYGGDYKLYINTEGKVMPMIVIIINNYEAFSENYEDKYDDILLTLTREGSKCGISFIFTVSSYGDMRYRLAQNFRQKIALQLNNDDDYYNIFESVGKKRPSHLFGRGLIKLDDIYEFQTARICDTKDWNNHIKSKIEQLKQENTSRAKAIPVLPKQITVKELENQIEDISKIPLGMIKKTLGLYVYDFKNNFVNIITAKNIDIATEFVSHLLEEFKILNNLNVVMLDAERIIQTDKSNVELAYKNLTLEIENHLIKSKHVLCIIIGLDKLINSIEEGEEGLYQMLKNAETLGNYSFILVENYTKFKNNEYDSWYKEYVSGDSGIWVGNGISDQYLLQVNSSSSSVENKCGESFGYVINREEPTLIKFVGMKGKQDDG